MEQDAIIEAHNAIYKEQETTKKILEFISQILEKSLEVHKAALQKIADIDDNA